MGEIRASRRALTGMAGALLALVVVASVMAPPASPDGRDLVEVLVRGERGGAADVASAVARHGGSVTRDLAILDGVVASVPASALGELRRADGVLGVTLDEAVGLLDVDGEALAEGWQDDTAAPYDADKDLGSMYHLTKAVGAHDAWSQHVTGEGVGVALIDSGVVPVEGLLGQVINGPDLSFESQDGAELQHMDSYGHGTHLAGIIAGRDSDVREGNEHDARTFVGVAPDAHVVNIKVASAGGAVDVSQVIAAIDWVVSNRDDPELNMRVLALAFGTDSLQDPRLDPLSHAVEAAWRHGIAVVVSAGNDGGPTPLRNPARNPYVIAVGAADHNDSNSLSDDLVTDFSNHGDTGRRVDIVAPGRSVASLRAPGSASDVDHPNARVGDRFFRGSGTSQAAAVTAGAVALLLEHRPQLTPDQIKDLLLRTAAPMPDADPVGRGAGQLDVKRAMETPHRDVAQTWPSSLGTGSLHEARGGSHLIDDEGSALVGETDIFGTPWDAGTWAQAAAAGRSWNGGTWNGMEWTGTCLCADSWAGRSWNGRSWNGRSWNGRSWNGRSWNGRSWNGRSWNSGAWSS